MGVLVVLLVQLLKFQYILMKDNTLCILPISNHKAGVLKFIIQLRLIWVTNICIKEEINMDGDLIFIIK